MGVSVVGLIVGVGVSVVVSNVGGINVSSKETPNRNALARLRDTPTKNRSINISTLKTALVLINMSIRRLRASE